MVLFTKLLKIIILCFSIFLNGYTLFGQDIPLKPDPPRLVNDFAGLLQSDEINSLEIKLVNFSNQTSTQIAVVIVNSLNGYDKADFAVRIGEEWGVGSKKFNNGIVVLVKTITSGEKGEVFIAPGYGIEHLVPDAICKRIVENTILPAFRHDQFYAGLDSAVNTLIALTKGEYTAEQYLQSSETSGGTTLLGVFIFFMILVFIFRIIRRAKYHSIGHGLPFWAAMSMMGGRSHGSGSFGNFSSGSGSFGGFGGGSFGGGGAGGSW